MARRGNWYRLNVLITFPMAIEAMMNTITRHQVTTTLPNVSFASSARWASASSVIG